MKIDEKIPKKSWAYKIYQSTKKITYQTRLGLFQECKSGLALKH